jgi:ribokinase
MDEMSRAKICVVGACNIDLISYVPRLPHMGETIHGHDFQIGFGGKGANQAVMAAKLGGRATMVSKLGRDGFGDDTMANFARFGVDTAYVYRTDQAPSGVAPIAVDTTGHNTIIIVVGANALLTKQEIEASRPAIAEADVLVCQLEIPLEITLAALRIGREEGVLTILNPAPAQSELPPEFYELSDIFCPNESEAELLTGRTIRTLEEAEAAGQQLLRQGAKAIVLTLGERGSLSVTAERVVHVPTASVVAVDTTGAGDAFVGSLALFLASGQDALEAIRRANQIAAISVQGRGTQSSFPSRNEIDPALFA